MLIRGEAGPPDPQRALPLLQAAAAANHPLAQYELAQFYEVGQLVPKNLTVARNLYAAAASHGMKEAQARLDQLGRPRPRCRRRRRPVPALTSAAATLAKARTPGTLYWRRARIPRPGEFMRDPYQVLGVAKSASEAEIKKAFRNLAKKHHPDTHAGDEAAKKRFQEISAAYDIIGDKDKRAKFDAGEIDASGNPRGFDPRAGGFRANPFGFGGGGPGRARPAATGNFISAGTITPAAARAFPPRIFSRSSWAAAAGAARAATVLRAARISPSPSPPASPKA